MAKNSQPIVKRCRALGISPAAMGYTGKSKQESIRNPGAQRRGKKSEYDLIIIDSSDPYGPAEGLFTREFYGTCFKALRDDGILINQHESPFYAAHQKSVRDAHRHIAVEFPVSTVYQCHIPSYPSGHWLFGFASKKYHPIGNLDEARWNKLRINTRYYNTALHRGAFALPNYVLDILKEEESK